MAEEDDVIQRFGAEFDEDSYEAVQARIAAFNARIAAEANALGGQQDKLGRDAERRLRNQQKLEDAYRQEADANAEKFLKFRIDRENAAQRNATSIAQQLTRDDQQELRRRVAQEATSQKEAAAIRKQMVTDEVTIQRQVTAAHEAGLKARLASEERQRAEALAIMRAMQADESAMRKAQLAQEKYETVARESLQRQRSTALIRIAREAENAAGGGGGGGGGGGNFRPSSFALRRTIVEAGTVAGVGQAGTLASLAAYGPVFAAIGVGLASVAVEVYSIKQAMAETKAEADFAAAVRTVGRAYDEAHVAAIAFHDTAIANRVEAIALATAVERVRAAGVEIRPEDIKKISTIAIARGEKPEETAKLLQALGKGDTGAFEEQTGLKATIVTLEYARAHNVAVDQLTKTQKAQALVNAYLGQYVNLTDLAAKRMGSAEVRWETLKNKVSDISSTFGLFLLAGADPATALTGTLAGPIARRLGFKPPQQPTAVAGPQETAAIFEVGRQAQLAARYETLELAQNKIFKDFDKDSSGKTTIQKYRELIQAQDDFQSSIAGLDPASEVVQKFADKYEKALAPAINEARTAALGLQKEIRGGLAEFSGLELAGEKNPYVKFFSDAEDAARKAHDKFKALGPDVERQFTGLYQAEANAHIYEQKITDTMKAMSLEFEASNLSKPFIQLTGEMKRAISIFDAELKAVSGAGQLFQARQIETGGAIRYGTIGGPLQGAHGQELVALEALNRKYIAQGGRGGEEIQHILNQQFIRLYGQLTPGERQQVFRHGDARLEFSGAFRGEEGYGRRQVELAIQHANVQRSTVQEAEAKLRELQRLAGAPGATGEAQRGATRAAILGLTGALPREDLSPDLLRARIGALTEEAQHQRMAQDAAIKAVQQAEDLQKMLDSKLEQIKEAIAAHDQSVLFRILDDSSKVKIQSLGPAMSEPVPIPNVGFAQGFRE